jgi:transposase
MTRAQVEVITSVQRRRRWSRAEKERIVAAAIEPGAVASEVARAAGIHTSQLFRWRQQLCSRAPAALTFAPVAVSPDAGAISPPVRAVTAGVIEIEFATGTRMRICGPANASTVRAMVTVLSQVKRRRR